MKRRLSTIVRSVTSLFGGPSKGRPNRRVMSVEALEDRSVPSSLFMSQPTVYQEQQWVHPLSIKGFNPQPEPPVPAITRVY